ncbi:hypothetical protein GAO09_18085 [Rhizobiales bacterium RZME27]|uniref:Lectin-like protein BA14k n=1 Tax=Endobacterium cereale TaxID=2663029 RepID=A0A6A8ADY1_9HYPH|nr:BA14K family protein [Endobacterium cereale]MEB2847591.1 BA14K family protein [Endobacterium cereale]MQY47950.1 hypothetical protein [Endobacterium cereale]
MKPIVTVPLKLATCLTLGVAGVIGAVYAASFVMTDYTPHHFAHMDAPLWTDKPVVVDRSAQALERLPALVASADVPAQENSLGGEIDSVANAVPPKRSADRFELASSQNDDPMFNASQAPMDTQVNGGIVELSAAHIDWCFAQYRSYRIEDNSFQPFDAPERRECQSPHEGGMPVADASSMDDGALPLEPVNDTMTGQTVVAEEPQMVAASGGVDSSWCFAQYRSYRAEDNSYQPFDGGPRRQCLPRERSY